MLNQTPTPARRLCGIVAIVGALLLFSSFHAMAVGPSNGPVGTVTEADPDNYDYNLPSPPSPAGEPGAVTPRSADVALDAAALPAPGAPGGSDSGGPARGSGSASAAFVWWVGYFAAVLR